MKSVAADQAGGAWHAASGTPPGRVLPWRALPAGACIAAVGILASPYVGIEGDARIYMGRAMADLDPAGVGRDIMFAQDGQADFSIFRVVAAKLVGWFGLSHAVAGLSAINTVAWLAAAAVLVGLFAVGRARGLLVVCAAVLPSFYAFYPLWEARETIATPRPLSEACVLLAIAAGCRRRTALSLALLVAAGLFHPIMALPGFAVVGLLLGLRDRRWLAAAGALVLVVVAAALAGVPVVARLVSVMDAPWRTLLEERNPYLFVGHWGTAVLAPLSVQVVTLGIAAASCQGTPRHLLLAVLAVGFAGLAAGWVGGDLLSLVLVLQAQPWRALWLVSFMAMPAFGLCALHLRSMGPLGRIALACLALSWLSFDILALTSTTALLAFGLFLLARQHRPTLSRPVEFAVYASLLAAAISLKVWDVSGAVAFARSAHRPVDVFAIVLQTSLLAAVAVPVALAWAVRRDGDHRPTASVCLCLALLAGVAATRDGRSEAARRVETGVHDPALEAMVASRAGEVLWLGNDDEWYWLGRPQWNGVIQGAPSVFSRTLALQWRERTMFLIDLGLVGLDRYETWRVPGPIVVPALTPRVTAALCGRTDAPAWIIAPLPAGRSLPDGVPGALWHAPVVETMSAMVEDKPVRESFDTYAVVPCAGGVDAGVLTPRF